MVETAQTSAPFPNILPNPRYRVDQQEDLTSENGYSEEDDEMAELSGECLHLSHHLSLLRGPPLHGIQC